MLFSLNVRLSHNKHILFRGICYTRKSSIWILIRVAGSYLLLTKKKKIHCFIVVVGFLHSTILIENFWGVVIRRTKSETNDTKNRPLFIVCVRENQEADDIQFIFFRLLERRRLLTCVVSVSILLNWCACVIRCFYP